MTKLKSHSFHNTIIREYDIRGVYDETLFDKDAEILGNLFGLEVGKNKNVNPKVNNKPDKYQSHLAKINSYLDKNGIVNNDKYKNYLESKNYSEELKQCLILRNILMTELVISGETKRLLSQWVPSPVPAVWIARLGIFWILELIMNPYFSSETLEKGAKKCNQFEHLWPSEKYLDLTFEE